MAKKPFKFFKPIYSEKHKPKLQPKVVGATTILLTLSMLIGLLAFQQTPVTMNMKADPVVWEHIVSSSGEMYVTITYKGNINADGLSIQRQWQFGDLKICLLYTSPSPRD